MTDRELLEYAAKAAGIEYDLRDAGQYWEQFGIPLPKVMSHEPTVYWNSLTDDGDALRLAAKLGFSLHVHPSCIGISRYGEGRYLIPEPWQEIGLDPYAATRRAITRAAAEIGKEMK